MDVDPVLEELVSRWESCRDQGKPVVLEDLCREHPERLDEVRGLLRRLEDLDRLIGTTRSAADADPSRGTDGIAEPSSIRAVQTRSDYRIVRYHARGGLGEVFIAHDEVLGREVALKLIQERISREPDRRSRFVREAEITGRLEHPGIVPVYGVGQGEDGRPCYAMRFIHGETLQSAIVRFHRSEPSFTVSDLVLRSLLSRLVAICNAVAYAHGQGVVHRDLKPSNVMLGPFNETLVVDWGLAKQRDRSDDAPPGHDIADPASSSDGSRTRTGSTVGTPAYMSPEQASGRTDDVGPASDIYSLGATLYHVLTGQSPFKGRTFDVLMDAVRRGDFPSPRSLKARIPKALEAVCLKAMALSPQDRYLTSLDLAADLERWLAGEPVSAWREPPSVRAGRWARRHRTAVTTVAVGMLVALAGTAAVLAVQTRANADLKTSNMALLASNDRERARFGLAMDAIKLFHGEVSEDFLLKEKPFKSVRTKLLRGAAGFYGKLEGLLADKTDPSSRAALGKAYVELADLTAKIGDKSEALAVHRKALAVRRELAARPGVDVATKLDLIRSLNNLAALQGESGDHSGAMASFREGEAAIEHLAAEFGVTDAIKTVQARCRSGMGLELRRTGNAAEAIAAFERARAIHQSLAAADPNVAEYRSDAASETLNIGILWLEAGKTSEALTAFNLARDIFNRLAEAEPKDAQTQLRLAITCNDIGAILSDIGRPAEALSAYHQARKIHQKLTDDNPNVTLFQLSLGYALDNIGWVYQQTGMYRDALIAHQTSVEIVQKLADANPTNFEIADLLGTCRMGLGDANRFLGKLTEAKTEYERALTIHEARLKSQPADVLSRLRVAENLLRGGLIRLNNGEKSAAEADLRRSVSLFEMRPLATQNWDMNQMAYAYAALSGITQQSEPADRAMQLFRKLVAAGYRYPIELQSEPALNPLRTRPDFQSLLMDLAFPAKPFAR